MTTKKSTTRKGIKAKKKKRKIKTEIFYEIKKETLRTY